jgi:hypothetical protein
MPRGTAQRRAAEPNLLMRRLSARFKVIDARLISIEAALNAPRSPVLPQWKIDFAREAIKIIEAEKGTPVTAAMIARRIPSLSMTDIEIAVRFLLFRYSCEEPRPGGFLCSADRIVHQM